MAQQSTGIPLTLFFLYCRPVVPEVLLGKGGSLDATSVVDKTQLLLIGCRYIATLCA